MKRKSMMMALAGCWLLAAADAAADDRPNVLFLAADDLKPLLGCYGSTVAKTPNIDRLAARGVVFERAYVQQAVCGPSRASLLSGLRPDATGVTVNATHLREKQPEAVLLPGHFKRHGYHTLALGKIHHWDEDGAGSWSEPLWRPFGMGPSTREYLLPENIALVRKLWEEAKRGKKKKIPALDSVKGPPWEAADLINDVYPDALTADAAVQALGRLKDGKKPFFLAVGFIKPHLPFACPQPYWDLYDPAKLELAENDAPPAGMPGIAFQDSEEMRQYHGTPAPGERFSEPLSRKFLHGYLACVSYMDAQVGRVLDALDQSGLAGKTIIVLWGDHGWHLGEQGIWGKATNFEEAARAPLIVSVPGLDTAGRKARGLAEFVDIYPTLADLCGLPLPVQLQGRSLAPQLKDPAAPGKTAAFSQFLRPGQITGYSMRTERWRYTEWSGPDGAAAGVELYDHETDPRETVNVADRAEHAALKASLSGELRAARASWQPVAAEPDEEGFMSLFNGRDLSGWDGLPGAWSVRDGAIVSGGPRKNWLVWRGGEVKNFELRLRFRYTSGNSGVQVRSDLLADWQVRGYQVEVAPRDKMGLWHQSLWALPERQKLSLAGQRVRIAPDGARTVEQAADPVQVQEAFKENDWNDLIVTGRGRKLVQIINGVVFSELVDEDRVFSRLQGVIALQDHGNRCVAEFKDIRLKHLP